MERLSALREELRSAQVQCRRLGAKARYQHKRHESHPTLPISVTRWEKEFMLTLHALAGYDAKPSVLWLRQRRGQLSFKTSELEEIIAWVEQWFLDLPEIALVRLWHPETRRAARILELARRIRQDINLCDWIHSENISKGVAQRTEACMVVYDSTSTHSADADDTESNLRANLLTSTNRMFAARFRARWGIELTKMKERTALRPHVLRQKAATQCAQTKNTQGVSKK